MFGQGYVLGVIVTTLGLYAWSKYKLSVEREEKNDKDRTN